MLLITTLEQPTEHMGRLRRSQGGHSGPKTPGSIWLPQELCPGPLHTHLIIWGTVTLEFSSKAFIIRPLQRMLSTHWKRHE